MFGMMCKDFNIDAMKVTFNRIINAFTKSDISNKIVVWEDLVDLYTDCPGGVVIKSKIYNLLKLLNETRERSEEEYQKLLKRDIETDVWYII